MTRVTAGTTPGKKMILYFTFECRNSVNQLSTPISKNLLRINMHQQRLIPKADTKISHCGSRSPKYIKLGHFTLLFCRGRQRNVQSFKTHVHSYCSAHQTLCLATFPLPSPSWFAKTPYCFPRQQRPAFTDWETRGHLYFLSWLTIMATTADNHVFSTSQIQCNWKWNSNGIEAEAEAMEFESGERCFMPIYFHFLRNATDCGLDKMRVRSKHLYVCCFSRAFWFWYRSLSGRSSFKWCYGR